MAITKPDEIVSSVTDILSADPVYQAELRAFGERSVEQMQAAEEFLDRLRASQPTGETAAEAEEMARLINVLRAAT